MQPARGNSDCNRAGAPAFLLRAVEFLNWKDAIDTSPVRQPTLAIKYSEVEVTMGHGVVGGWNGTSNMHARAWRAHTYTLATPCIMKAYPLTFAHCLRNFSLLFI